MHSYYSSSEGIRWSKILLFGLNYGVNVGGDKKTSDHILTLSSTGFLFMHKEETTCFLPDRPHTSRKGVWPGGF